MVGISTSLTQSMKRTRRLRTEFQEVLDEANWSTTASSFLSEQGALAGDGSRDVDGKWAGNGYKLYYTRTLST